LEIWLCAAALLPNGRQTLPWDYFPLARQAGGTDILEHLWRNLFRRAATSFKA
jgi:hypothetical protein